MNNHGNFDLIEVFPSFFIVVYRCIYDEKYQIEKYNLYEAISMKIFLGRCSDICAEGMPDYAKETMR
ncbi:MAG: hypothetical protein U9Q92_01610 [archaeon]|nr:hypothetical protein [archaeon]